jgi:hypothetical protein
MAVAVPVLRQQARGMLSCTPATARKRAAVGQRFPRVPLTRSFERSQSFWSQAQRNVRRSAGGGIASLLVGQFTERDGKGFRFSASKNIEFDRTAGSQCRYLAGKIAGVFDRRAVECSDDIAGLDACPCSWTSILRLIDHRTFRRLHAKAVGDALGYRLNL